ncbi:MAG: hypothetical protein KAT25_09025 [Sulfuriflexus sp.]|nr:hypothetical protein [Sulfuriflexus sp.]
MKTELPQEKKITAECRVEGGCLGPVGDDYVDGFCNFAKDELAFVYAHIVNWQIVPRRDKSLSEMQYKVANKNLSKNQAKKYFELFGEDINEFESLLDDKLIALIEQYMSKQ